MLDDNPMWAPLNIANLKLASAYDERDELRKKLAELNQTITNLEFEQQDAYAAWYAKEEQE